MSKHNVDGKGFTRQDALEGLVKELEDMKAVREEAEKTEKGIEEIEGYREPLSIEVVKEVRILLSWGGGEDGFLLRFDKENDLISGKYYIADWGTYADIELSDEELDLVYDYYLYSDSSFLSE